MPSKIPAFVMVLVLLLAGGYLGYRYYEKRQPRASVDGIVAACQERDVIKFQKYVNLDAVVSNALEGLKQKMTPKANGDGPGEIERFGAALGQTMVQMVAPGVLQQVKTGVLQAVSSGRLSWLRPCGSGLFGGSDTKDCSVLVESVVKQDRYAKVTLSVTKADGQQSVRFIVWMQPRESHWQVVSVENLQEVLMAAPALVRD